MTHEELEFSKRSIFIIKTTEKTFYSSLFILKNKNIIGIKYDLSCMYPVNTFAKKSTVLLEEIIKSIKPIEIQWQNNKTVIFDNWKTLHARAGTKTSETRELKRVYIK